MIPSFKPGILSSNRIRAVASADVTPNAVNWNDVSAPGGSTNTVTITGINTAINLSISWTGYGVGAFNVYKNDSETSLADEGSPYTLSVSNNDEIYFYATTVVEQSISVTVTNASDGNTVLDTFTINTGEDGGGGG
jgi:hypothetical protein